MPHPQQIVIKAEGLDWFIEPSEVEDNIEIEGIGLPEVIFVSRALAAALAPVLQWYADTGELPDGPVTAADTLRHRSGNDLMDAIGAQMRATLERSVKSRETTA